MRMRIRGWHVNTFTTLSHHPPPTTMTCGKALSDDAQSILFKLFQSDEFTMGHLSALTDVNRRTIYRIIQHWEATGGVERDGKRTGRPRLLDYPDVQVSCSVPALTGVLIRIPFATSISSVRSINAGTYSLTN